MTRIALALATAASFALAGCYTVRTNAPPGTSTMFASDGEACAQLFRKRVHYALAGLVPINSNQVDVPGNARVRVVAETDALDTVLRALGAVFTFGLYGGTQSALVEVCQPVYVAAAPGAAYYSPPPAPAPPPPPPPGSTIEVHVDPATLIDAAGALGGARGPRGGGGGRSVPVRDTGQAMCNSSIDCGSGEFCRDRGDGVKLCMGNGVNGDFCDNGTDCGSGLFCRQAGDGYKRCM